MRAFSFVSRDVNDFKPKKKKLLVIPKTSMEFPWKIKSSYR